MNPHKLISEQNRSGAEQDARRDAEYKMKIWDNGKQKWITHIVSEEEQRAFINFLVDMSEPNELCESCKKEQATDTAHGSRLCDRCARYFGEE